MGEGVNGVVLGCRGVLPDGVWVGAHGIDAALGQVGLVGLALKVPGDHIGTTLCSGLICAGG